MGRYGEGVNERGDTGAVDRRLKLKKNVGLEKEVTDGNHTASTKEEIQL